MTVEEFIELVLEDLDGYGLTITDYDLLKERIEDRLPDIEGWDYSCLI